MSERPIENFVGKTKWCTSGKSRNVSNN